MERLQMTPAAREDAREVAELIVALEASLYGASELSATDVQEQWADLDLERNTRIVRDRDRIVGYSELRELGERWRAEGYVRLDAHGRGIGTLLAATLEEDAARGGARRIQNSVLEADKAARALLESRGYEAVRVYREMRIDLDAQPPKPRWPPRLTVTKFDPAGDAEAFHAALEEAFEDHWGHTRREFDLFSRAFLETDRFDPDLWCVVRAGTEIAAGAVSTADTYGGGFVHLLFTRRPWRRQGVGAALLADAFGRFWERGERSIGLGVDAENDTGAFRLYERAGMRPALGWVLYEKALDDGG
jgi:GNAT superfamily N-acetyltransferase